MTGGEHEAGIGNELVVMVRTAAGLGAVHVSLETLELARFVKLD